MKTILTAIFLLASGAWAINVKSPSPNGTAITPATVTATGCIKTDADGVEFNANCTAGKVGIGTAVPSSKLHISSGVLMMQGTGTQAQIISGSALPTSGNTPATVTPLVLSLNTNDTDPNSSGHIMLNDSGTLGADRGGHISFSARSNTDQMVIHSGIYGARTNASAGSFAGYLDFHTRNLAGTNASRMKIDSEGNVGIGTASPATKLHLSSGTITVDGNVAQGIHLVTGSMGFSSDTEINIRAKDPVRVGEAWYCSDCAAAALCVSTGTALGDWADSGDRTASCD